MQWPCTLDQLRKDLVGLDVPTLCLKTTLDGLEVTPKFDPKYLHDQFYNRVVEIELCEPPQKPPFKVKLYLNTGQDLGKILQEANMVKAEAKI